MERRLEEVEELLVRRVRTPKVEAHCAKKYGVSTRMVRKYIRRVRDRWAEEAAALGPRAREERRAQMRATLETILSEALMRQVPLKDAVGTPMINPATGKPHMVASPDHRSALHACRQLAHLDALEEPKVQHLHHSGIVGTHESEITKSPEEIRHFLRLGHWPSPEELATATPAE